MPLTLPGIAAGAATFGRQVNLGLKTAGHMLRNSAIQPHLMGMMQRLKQYEPAGLAGLLARFNPSGATAHAAPALPPRPGAGAGAKPPPLPPRPGSASRPPPLPPRRAAHPLQTRYRETAALAAQQSPEEPEDLSKALIRRPPQEDLEDMSKALVRRPPGDVGTARPQGPATHGAVDRPPPLPPRPAQPAQARLAPVLAMALDNVRQTVEAQSSRLPAGMARQIQDIVTRGLRSLNDALGPHLAAFEARLDEAASRHGEYQWLAEAGENNALSLLNGQAVPGQDPHRRGTHR